MSGLAFHRSYRPCRSRCNSKIPSLFRDVEACAGGYLVCGDITLEKHKGYWTLDCAAATENMLLAAHAKGLGAVWCGVYPTEDRVANLKRLLNLPENIVPFSLVPLGFPAEEKQAPDRFDGSRVHENRWP
jgi:hypothetical protein